MYVSQCVELQDWITVPAFARGRLTAANGAVNVWLGTKGTVTALHRDPYMNLLCQVAGFKYIRIYDDDQTKWLYPNTIRPGNKNTFTRCPVEVEAPDLDRYPLFARATFSECVLGPGSAIFIPKNAWHYIRSLSTSVSINFWF